MDINLISSILAWITGSIVGVAIYRKNIIDNVNNKGQYFIQTKDDCYVVIHAHPEGELLPILEEEESSNEIK